MRNLFIGPCNSGPRRHASLDDGLGRAHLAVPSSPFSATSVHSSRSKSRRLIPRGRTWCSSHTFPGHATGATALHRGRRCRGRNDGPRGIRRRDSRGAGDGGPRDALSTCRSPHRFLKGQKSHTDSHSHSHKHFTPTLGRRSLPRHTHAPILGVGESDRGEGSSGSRHTRDITTL